MQKRNRYDIKFFFKRGGSLQWTSNPVRILTPFEMVQSLREIADMIERAAVETTLTTNAESEAVRP